MLLLHFNYEELDKCETVVDVFKTFGIDKEVSFDDEKVFGKRAFYANMFLSPETVGKIESVLDDKMKGRTRKTRVEKILWTNYAPLCTGPRYKQLVDTVGELKRDILYIVTPTDSLYKEADAN